MTKAAERKPVADDLQATADHMAPHMLRGSLWMGAMRWAIRGIGLASTSVDGHLSIHL